MWARPPRRARAGRPDTARAAARRAPRRLAALGAVAAGLALAACSFGDNGTAKVTTTTVDQGLPTVGSVAEAQRGSTVILHGDSLAWEAAPVINAALSDIGLNVVDETVSGTAPCDALGQLATDLLRRPAVVVFAYSGNNLTACTVDPATGTGATGDALVARYAADARAATDVVLAGGAKVLWVAPPPMRDAPPDDARRRLLLESYGPVAVGDGTVKVIDGSSVLTTDGITYARSMPCLPFDACDGDTVMVTVRAPDGVHFCPLAFDASRRCEVWSSGAARYGLLIATEALALVAPQLPPTSSSVVATAPAAPPATSQPTG